MRPDRAAATRAMLVAAGAAAAVLALELVLRASGYSSPAWYRADPVLGWGLRPGASGWFTREGKAFVEINAAGQRDREHDVAKPAGVYRIAVLGDAYSEGMQVALEKTYWAQLPERLEKCGFQPGKRIEVLNFGVRDYGTGQSYLVLKTEALRYSPDLVLLQISHGNDLRDNSPALDRIKGRPYVMPDGKGGLRVDESFTSSAKFLKRDSASREALRELADDLRLLQLARSVAREIKPLQPAHARDTGNPAGLEIPALAPPHDPDWVEAWRTTEAIIAGIGELARSHGARAAVVTVPFAMEVHPDARRREALQAQLGVTDFSYPERRIESFAAQAGMLPIRLGPQMRALAEAGGAALYGFDNFLPGLGHWNELGHRAAADLIARRLCAAGSAA